MCCAADFRAQNLFKKFFFLMAKDVEIVSLFKKYCARNSAAVYSFSNRDNQKYESKPPLQITDTIERAMKKI